MESVFLEGLCPEVEDCGHFLEYFEKVELSVRIKLRAKLQEAAIQHMDILGPARRVWFEVTYPTPMTQSLR